MGTKSSKLRPKKDSDTKSPKSLTLKSVDPAERCALQNYLLIWADDKIEVTSKSHQQALERLRNVVNDLTVFTAVDTCATFLQGITKEKVFVIVSDRLGRELLPRIHPMVQLDTIYISSNNRSRCEKWTKDWCKIKGIYARFEQIHGALQLSIKQCNQDSIPVSFAQLDEKNSDRNLNELEPSFMYTQLFKSIVLDIEYGAQSLKDLVAYCREKQVNVPSQMKIIDEYERSYQPNDAIWWYTRECFLYQMLNRALRLMEADIIVNMGFFIRDLHQQIEQLHQQQVKQYKQGRYFTVYRGQGLSAEDFEKLKHSQGGLMSFNSFLSTSTDRVMSQSFAKKSALKMDTVGILFVMTIDPAIILTPFAVIDQHSYFKTEAEVLFSTHTVFRIGDIQNMEKHVQLFEVQLTLTADDDEQLRALTKRIEKEIQGSTGLQRMVNLLIRLGQLDEAKELNTTLLKLTPEKSEGGDYYHH